MTNSITLSIDGMTCHNCVSHVQRALSGLPEVEEVSTTLAAGGTSTVLVTLNGDVTDEQLSDLIAEEGYTLVGVQR